MASVLAKCDDSPGTRQVNADQFPSFEMARKLLRLRSEIRVAQVYDEGNDDKRAFFSLLFSKMMFGRWPTVFP